MTFTQSRPARHGPGFVTGTVIHHAEHAAFALALAVALGWLVFVDGATDLWRVLVWLVAPDLVFVPIGLAAARNHGQWPPWGAPLYNATHTHLVVLASLVIASTLQGHVVWPLLAWALHVEADRALGFDIRAWS